MNREIKFRVWDKKQKKFNDNFFVSLDGKLLIDLGYNQLEFVSDDEFILTQSIGLKDKNEKEIFEGDIVKEEYDIFAKREGKIFTVEYMILNNCGDCFKDSGIGFNLYLHEAKHLEIIGNIFETPEIEVEKKK